MIALIIALYVLAVGKIHAQQTVASHGINSQPLPITSLNRRLVPLPQVSRLQPPSVPPPRLIQNPIQPSNYNCDHPEHTGTDLDLTHATLRENQPRRRLFISRLIPAKMPSERTNLSSNSTTAQKSSDVYDDVNIEQENTANGSNPPVTNVTTRTLTGNVITTTKPQQNEVMTPLNTTEITLDERASFDGDQCPTGYVRLNGKCVPKD